MRQLDLYALAFCLFPDISFNTPVERPFREVIKREHLPWQGGGLLIRDNAQLTMDGCSVFSNTAVWVSARLLPFPRNYVQHPLLNDLSENWPSLLFLPCSQFVSFSQMESPSTSLPSALSEN